MVFSLKVKGDYNRYKEYISIYYIKIHKVLNVLKDRMPTIDPAKNREYVAKYRAKLKENPEKYKEYLEKANQYQKDKCKLTKDEKIKKLVDDFNKKMNVILND